MDDYPIKLAKSLITLVDPHEGFEKAYNRWYERDHFYGGCMIGAGWFAGSRWVAPRELKDLRFPNENTVASPVDAGSFVAIYWVIKDQEDPTWAGRQVRYLYANNRGFDQRTHVHTKVYDLLRTTYRDPDDGVPVELALDHKYPGIALVFVDPADGVTQEELADWLASDAAPVLFEKTPTDMIVNFFMPPPDPELVAQMAAQAASMAAEPGAKPAPGAPGGPTLGTEGGKPDRIVQLCFVEGNVKDAWDGFRAYGAKIDAGGKGRVTFAAPFYRTVVGTDTYVDQIW